MGLVNITDIQTGDDASAALWNARFAAIIAQINGNIDTTNLANGAVTTAKMGSGVLQPNNFSNPYKFSAYRSAGTTSSSTPGVVQFDAEVFDTSNNFDITTNKGRFTATVSGFYQFNAMVGNTLAGANNTNIWLYKNGTVAKQGGGNSNGASPNGHHYTVNGMLQLSAGDYVEVYFQGGNGSAVDVGQALCWFDGYMISGT